MSVFIGTHRRGQPARFVYRLSDKRQRAAAIASTPVQQPQRAQQQCRSRDPGAVGPGAEREKKRHRKRQQSHPRYARGDTKAKELLAAAMLFNRKLDVSIRQNAASDPKVPGIKCAPALKRYPTFPDSLGKTL